MNLKKSPYKEPKKISDVEHNLRFDMVTDLYHEEFFINGTKYVIHNYHRNRNKNNIIGGVEVIYKSNGELDEDYFNFEAFLVIIKNHDSLYNIVKNKYAEFFV